VDNIVSSYKLSPQAHYMVDRMAESEKTLLEAVNKLSMKFDSYDKHLTSLGSNIANVQSQVDLSIKSIQTLQQDQVVLVKSMNAVGSEIPGSNGSSGLMGSSPGSASAIPVMTPYPPPQPPKGDLNSQTFHPFSFGKGTLPIEGDFDHMCH
jgi:hypothetical protein